MQRDRGPWAERPIFGRARTQQRPGRAAALAVIAALALAGGAAAQDGAAPLSQRLASALAVPNVNQGRSSAVALDLATGQVVFTRRGRLSLAPASTEKLPLSYALLVNLGPTYRIRTSVLGDGELEGTTWYGDLVLTGQGDPTLSTAGLGQLARRIHALGIRRVTGAVVGDESFFDVRRTGPGWKPSYYIRESPPLSALAVDRARYRGAVAPRPALAAAAGFRAALAAAGVAVALPARLGVSGADANELAALASPPLGRILRLVNRDSDNYAAELLLKHLGAVVAGQGTTAAGAAAVRRSLKLAGVPAGGVRFVDGSGLSPFDRLTADSLVAILRAAWRDPLLRGSFLASLAVAGRNGTLEHRLTRPPARGRIFAKTGTTSLASALAGYVAGRYAFALLNNGPPLQAWWCRQAQDRFATVLAAQ